MSIRPILRMGSPLLNSVSAVVGDLSSPEIIQLIEDMWDTVLHLQGAGIAAPQIGCAQRVILFGVTTPRYKNVGDVPATLLINPKITVLDATEIAGLEGCLSVPGLRGMVPRFAQIHYSGYDLEGRRIEREASGFHARVVQHECDHLDGFLFPQRMRDFSQFGFEDQLEARELSEKSAPAKVSVE